MGVGDPINNKLTNAQRSKGKETLIHPVSRPPGYLFGYHIIGRQVLCYVEDLLVVCQMKEVVLLIDGSLTLNSNQGQGHGTQSQESGESTHCRRHTAEKPN